MPHKNCVGEQREGAVRSAKLILGWGWVDVAILIGSGCKSGSSCHKTNGVQSGVPNPCRKTGTTRITRCLYHTT